MGLSWVFWLAQRAHARGLRVAVLGHGYRGRGAPRRSVACVERPDANLYGDEASALRRALPSEVGVWVGAFGLRKVQINRRVHFYCPICR